MRRTDLPICQHRVYISCTNEHQRCSRCQVGVEWAGKMALMQDRFTPEQGPQTPIAEAEEIQ